MDNKFSVLIGRDILIFSPTLHEDWKYEYRLHCKVWSRTLLNVLVFYTTII